MADQSVIQWLAECFREDRTRAGVRDFFSSSVEMRRVMMEREKLATGEIDEDLLTKGAIEFYNKKLMYQREKEILYGCLFLCGMVGGKAMRAPLILYPAELQPVSENVVTIRLDYQRWRVNRAVFDEIDKSGEIESAVAEVIDDGLLTEATVSSIGRIFNQFSLGVNSEPLFQWPLLTKSGDINKAGKENLTIYPASGMMLVARSRGARGVIDELDQLGKLNLNHWSSSLNMLLNVEKNTVKEAEEKEKALLTPTLLSLAQERIARSARQNTLTVCHGPPGTGKSFTIASIAVDHMLRGESVLITSKKDHAVDVVGKKIEGLVDDDNALVRVGRKTYLRKLKRYLDDLLKGVFYDDAVGIKKKPTSVTMRAKLNKLVTQIIKETRALEKEIETSIERGEVHADENPSFYKYVKQWWAGRSVKSRPLLAELLREVVGLYEDRDHKVRELAVQVREEVLSDVLFEEGLRQEVKDFLAAIRKHRSQDQAILFKNVDFKAILSVFPIWLCSADDVHRTLPMKRELFDLAIIDESSQCDLASILPILQRAKRVVVAGDTKQLRHVSFLSRRSMEKFARELNIGASTLEELDYRDVSLMDLANERVADLSQSGFLNEQFRSHKEIIRFSNREFYHDQLHVMKDIPGGEMGYGLLGEYCEGRRDSLGVNQVEVEAIIDNIRYFYESSGIAQYANYLTLGVLSPFRAQVDAIDEALKESFTGAEYRQLVTEFNLRVGTAHSFQGEERDVMMISLVVDASVGSQTLRYLEQEDVFNVSITRAKLGQYVYHSITSEDLPQESLLKRFLDELPNPTQKFLQKKKAQSADFSHADAFLDSLIEHCMHCNIKVLGHKTVAGVKVDVLLEKDGVYIGVDLVGYPGALSGAVEVQRIQTLSRAGFRLLPVGYVEWMHRTNECMDVIVSVFNELTKNPLLEN